MSGCDDPQGIGPALLHEYGIPQAETRPAASPEDAAHLAGEMGFPVVIKVLSPDILHKTDVGGVRVGLKSAGEVRETARIMLEEVAHRQPAARLTGLTVSRQVPIACELLLGMRSDPQFGPIVAVGLGGVAAHLWRRLLQAANNFGDHIVARREVVRGGLMGGGSPEIAYSRGERLPKRSRRGR